MSTFSKLVPSLQFTLRQHHDLYSGRCKGEYWEENCATALEQAGFGSDWKPDFNHGVGTDQVTNCGIRISNKSGKITNKGNTLEISGSRLTSYKTLDEKLAFLSNKHEDYIFCLATDEKDWKANVKRYKFVVIDSVSLNYHEAAWTDMRGTKASNQDQIVGHSCIGNGYTAKIQKSMSDQIWTKIDSVLFKEAYDIIV